MKFSSFYYRRQPLPLGAELYKLSSIFQSASFPESIFNQNMFVYKRNAMATDNVKARKEEKENINVHDALELRYWSNLYGVTKEIILEAVRESGDSKNDVEKYLKNKNLIKQ